MDVTVYHWATGIGSGMRPVPIITPTNRNCWPEFWCWQVNTKSWAWLCAQDSVNT